MACYRQYVDYFKTTSPYTTPPTRKLTAIIKPVLLQSFLVIWNAPPVKKKVSISRKLLKKKTDQQMRQLF